MKRGDCQIVFKTLPGPSISTLQLSMIIYKSNLFISKLADRHGMDMYMYIDWSLVFTHADAMW